MAAAKMVARIPKIFSTGENCMMIRLRLQLAAYALVPYH
jgi:hypothetical protein